ncbi:MAG: hypothetical protein IJW94_06435 [Oscillospiraceae bacterium]|nr:hypothetical protein [Oscillospiraceae bacterium]
MKKKIILIVAALLLIEAIAICFDLFAAPKALPPETKEEILQAYRLQVCRGNLENSEKHYRTMKMVWFDENGGERDAGVFRYFGTYGDCIVLLRYGADKGCVYGPFKRSFPMRGLSRPVYYPMECDIFLYNTDPNYTKYRILFAPLDSLGTVNYLKLGWLTQAQVERLTDDLEYWISKGNY